ncbi:bacteriocin-like protein [Elizabethkingia anophelis]|uniref:bacteriocin-like protein n=1 Tax=Elizabethkingia anophelis TaxID=1117645 RepID=UPI00259BEBD7|nr:hypothetical protein [Elizabethkingia anophelis]WJK01856.1 hypothetical protein QTN78_09075 [Elizabethkingia anophelis]
MKNLKKIKRAELKAIIGGGEPLPDGWGVCFVNGETVSTPCDQLCPDRTQPFCAW